MNLLRLLPRFRDLDAALSVLAERETWGSAELASYQLGRLNELWSHASVHVPFYARLAAAHSLPKRFETLDEFAGTVPVLDKAEVRSAPEAFLSESARPGGWHHTGGSTGIPMRVYWSGEAHRRSLHVKYRSEAARGLGVHDRKAFLWGHGASLAPGWQGVAARIRRPVEDRLRNRLRLSAYRLGPEDLAEHLRRMERFRPEGLYGYSSAVFLLAGAAEAGGVSIPSLRLVTLSAEPAHPWIVDGVRRGFDAPVLVEYGSVECGNMAASDAAGRLRVRQDHVLLETVARTGGGYDILVTVLYNPSFPLIRYRIGDVTSRPLQVPEGGFAWLADIGGRENDFLWTATGRRVHPQAVKHVVEHLPVSRFTARQNEMGALTLLLETPGELASTDRNHALNRLSKMLDGFPVHIETVERLPANPAGKHRWVISEAGPPAGGPAGHT